jgi:uncharacterized repeat protein (TIGR03803 family)
MGVAIAMLAGCGGAGGTLLNPSPVALLGERTHVPSTYSVLYSFGGESHDAENPDAGLIDVSGTFYSTTFDGGTSDYGTVFSVTASGKEAVLHSFPSGSGDGEYPWTAGLLNVGGTLYGTTHEGGTYGYGSDTYGTVFSITPSGKETVLHSFGGSGDGRYPKAPLIDVKGKLYGTTTSGGANGEGTVFAITTSGKETVVYSFKNPPDGESPDAPLTAVNGTLYGTTTSGGAVGAGTLFAITTAGKETVLHSFGTYPDGGSPLAGLVDVKGTLYGTTADGGEKDDGTVFAVTTSGKETVLHSFRGDPRDGSYPEAGLTDVAGTLYGTTYYGGVRRDDGTVFSMTTSGQETVLHTFKGRQRDGSYPEAGLLDVKGTLFGTTGGGGAHGEGTVFWLTP